MKGIDLVEAGSEVVYRSHGGLLTRGPGGVAWVLGEGLCLDEYS